MQLLLLTTAAAFGMSGNIVSIFEPTGRERACFLAAGVDLEHPAVANLAQALALNGPAIDACLARHDDSPTLLLALAWTTFTALAALAVFAALPLWRTRRSRYSPIADADVSGAIRMELAVLTREAGLRESPRVVVEPFASSGGGCVFGRTGRPVLRLHGGLTALAGTDRFRTVLRHELAHILNRDITLTYSVIAAWRAFVALILLPFIAAQVYVAFVAAERFPWGATTLGSSTVSIGAAAVMTVLVHLTRADILRTRELEADAAAHLPGTDPACSPDNDPRWLLRLPLPVQRFVVLWRTHPTWAMRRHALSDPASSGRIQPLTLALTGFGAVLVREHIQLTVTAAAIAPYLADLLAMAILAGVLTLALQRALSAPGPTRLPVGIAAGLWTGTGMALAVPLVSPRFALGDLPPHPEVLLVLPAVLAVFGWWTAQTLHVWTRGTVRGVWPRTTVVAGAGAIVLAGVWELWDQISLLMAGNVFDFAELREFWAAYTVVGLPPLGWSLSTDDLGVQVLAAWSTLQIVLFGPVVLTGVAILWALPLLLVVYTGRFSAESQPEMLPFAIKLGITAAFVSWLFQPVLDGLPMSRTPAVEPWFVLYVHWQLTLALLAALLAGGTAAFGARSHRLLSAIVVGQTAALTAVGGSLLIDIAMSCRSSDTSCIDSAGVVWAIFAAVFDSFPVLTAVICVLTALAASAWHQARKRPPLREITTTRRESRRRKVGRLTAAATASAVVLALTIWDGVGDARLDTAPSALNMDVFATVDFNASPEMLSAQVNAWFTEGGSDLTERLTNAIAGLQEVDADPTQEILVPERCGVFTVVAADARAFFIYPEVEGQEAWNRILTLTELSAHLCLLAYVYGETEYLDLAVDTLAYGLPDLLLAFLERILEDAG
ncbi:M48 family metalloprotease [Glycomyces sp. YM15]|uniref:M48 family metalloprotease n=1 Tax=Glycomyces sp. YM15 TaxID=2800446 RepID=UPI001963D8F5|nr:M48 family metalloprotease [Glycomyces sp. YM15]